MTKKLDTNRIASELQGSVFFAPREAAEVTSQPEIEPEATRDVGSAVSDRQQAEPPQRRASKRSSDDASKLASTPASSDVVEETIEEIRKVVKHPGKEVSFVRLTPQEKSQLADIVYTYKRQGTRTSENEINRIAVNYLLADYKENGAASVLARVLAALKA